MEVNSLLTDNPKKLISFFIIPTIAGQIIFAFSRTLEKVFIGQVIGNEAIAAVSVTFPLFTIIIAFSMWIRIGAGASISLELGRNNKEHAEKILGTTIVLLLIAAVAIMVFTLFFLDDILLIIGANKAILSMSVMYMRITIAGLILNFLAFGISHLIRAEGNPLKGMWMLVAGAILNIILSFLFIKKLEMGIFGAALAPVLGNSFTVLLIFLHFMKGRRRNLSIKKQHLKLDKLIIKKVMSIGFSAFIMMTGGSIVGMITNALLMKQGGVMYVGIMGGFVYSLLFIQIIITGLCYGFQPLFGYSHGHQNIKRLKFYLQYGLILAVIASVIACLVVFRDPSKIAALFAKNDANVVETAIPLMKLFFLSLPILGFNMLGAYFFQSIGKVKKAILLFFLQKGLVVVGLFILPLYLNIDGIFLSFSVAEFVLFIILLMLLYVEFKKVHLPINNKNQ